MTIYFGENIKKLRAEKELTQEALANLLGLSGQAVSKWERNESYPDITLLPAIAAFFGVTVDSLLGLDKATREQEIQSVMDRYLSLIHDGEFTSAREVIEQAVSEFPGDFRLLVRLMEVIVIKENTSDDGALAAYSKIKSLYESIQNYCMDDSIRMWSKRLMCTVNNRLQNVKESGVTSNDLTEILKQMPSMRNSCDYLSTYILARGAQHDEACRKAIDELVYLLFGAMANYCFYNDCFTPNFKIGVIESMNRIVDEVYPCEDYGINYIQTIYRYGHLGHLYCETGNNEKAIVFLQKCAELAKKYDALPEVSERTSPLFVGMIFKKEDTPKTHSETMSQRMKRLMLDKYPLSAEIKSSEEFGKIVELLR